MSNWEQAPRADSSSKEVKAVVRERSGQLFLDCFSCNKDHDKWYEIMFGVRFVDDFHFFLNTAVLLVVY